MTRARASLVGLAVLVVMAAGCASLGSSEYAAPAPYPNYVDESIFYAQLDPYGTWVEVPPYGLCWLPDDVPWGWRPYAAGYWAYTDYGWTWISNEPWGWATYHYGRWANDGEYGWVWVPGNDWAPAWVAWRASDDWVGWAALPPDASWNSAGLSGYDDNAIPADDWCFVRGKRMLNPDMQTSLAPSVRNQVLLTRTRDVTRFGDRDGRPVNHGVELVTVERLAGRQAPRLTILDVQHPESGHAQEVQGATVRMFRTSLRPAPPTTAAQVNHEPPHTPRPPRTAPPPVTSAVVLEKHRETQERQAQAALQREQLELNREQTEELNQAKSAAQQQEIIQRQAAERKAFEERRVKENQRLQAQLQRRFAKAGGDTTQVHKGAPKTVLNVKGASAKP